jgi:hypothetical protein
MGLCALALTWAAEPAPSHAAPTDAALEALQSARSELARLGEVLSAEWLIAQRVHGRSGALEATVSDLVVGEGGRLTAMIVQARGVDGARGGLFKIPWSQVELTSDYAQVLVPLTRYNAHNYRLRRATFAANERRLSMMLSARVALREGEPYGAMVDMVFTPQGELKAVLVEPFGREGYRRYAYPYRHEHYRDGIYTLAYGYSQLSRVALPDASILEIVPAAPPAIGAVKRAVPSRQLRYDSSFPFN